MTSLFGDSRRSAPFLGSSIAALFLALPLMAGCNGCNGGDLVCDAQGECQICDAYGCHDANQGSGTIGSGTISSGTIGSASGGAGGNASTTVTGTGGAGGNVSCDPQVVVCGCTLNTDCPSGQYCLDNLCLDGCNFDFECGSGKVCADGKCVASCSDTSPCPTGYACVSGACQIDATNPQCTSPADCGGMPCVDNLCTTGCTANTDCPSGQLCSSQTHTCFDDPSPKPLCGGNLQCPGQGQVCGTDGYCHYPCTDLPQCKLIDTRFVACEDSICKTKEEVSPQCDLDNPCPPPQSCISNTCVN
jgi:hypothetical protein